jgi:hypothetical protein
VVLVLVGMLPFGCTGATSSVAPTEASPTPTPSPSNIVEPTSTQPSATSAETWPPGVFIGSLAHFDVCFQLSFKAPGWSPSNPIADSYELDLPDGYTFGDDPPHIKSPDGIVFNAGDPIEVRGRLGGGGSYCMIGPILHATEIRAGPPR